jgi:D-alanyl-D-alanine carboxypeptidase
MAQPAHIGAKAAHLKKLGALCLSFSLAACAAAPLPTDGAAPDPGADHDTSLTLNHAAPVEPLSTLLTETPSAEDIELLASKKNSGTKKRAAPAPVAGQVCRSAVLMDMDGRILHSHNAATKRYPASVTKTMTLIMVFDAMKRGELKLTDKITFSAHAASRERTNLGLRAGAQVSVEDGIKALVVHSANDMAAAFAEHLSGGTEASFARLMTAKARTIGMNNTVFKNASGLPDPDMVTTAHDMALMSKYLIENYPNEYHYFSTRTFTFNGVTYRNHNKSLGTYPGVDGIKTGFTRASLFNVAVSAKRPEGRLIVTLFGCPSTPARTGEVEFLLNKGFDILRKRNKTAELEAPAPAQIPAVRPLVVGMRPYAVQFRPLEL